MSTYTATVEWNREGAPFTDQRYSRGHLWRFDGGATVTASSSPQVVPLPMSIEAAVDPEEAFVASLSSCHMLWFLSLAARRGLVVDSYRDTAVGLMEKDSHGQLAITRVTLRPAVRFNGPVIPDENELRALHKESHERCFIANSVKSEVLCEPVLDQPVPRP